MTFDDLISVSSPEKAVLWELIRIALSKPLSWVLLESRCRNLCCGLSRDDFDLDIVYFPFLDGDVPRRPSYGVYISQLIRFARVCSHVDDLNTRNKCLTAKLLKQGYRHHKLRKAFSKFYRRHYELISKFNVGLKSLLW